LERFVSVTVDDLTKLTGFSEEGTKAPAIVEGIRKAKSMIDDLAKCVRIVEPKPSPKPAAGGKLASLSFCFTGAIERMDSAGKRYTRKRMQELVMQNGGRAVEDVASGLTYLVQADANSTSSKTKKATKLGVTILSEADFWKMVEA
jgi:NAD-dependent DNA ligase